MLISMRHETSSSIVLILFFQGSVYKYMQKKNREKLFLGNNIVELFELLSWCLREKINSFDRINIYWKGQNDISWEKVLQTYTEDHELQDPLTENR